MNHLHAMIESSGVSTISKDLTAHNSGMRINFFLIRIPNGRQWNVRWPKLLSFVAVEGEVIKSGNFLEDTISRPLGRKFRIMSHNF